MADRDKSGKFLPGHSIKPTEEQYHAPLREYVKALNNELREEFSPAELTKMYRYAWERCVIEDDRMHMVKLLELISSRVAGKPTEVMETGDGDVMSVWQAIARSGPAVQLMISQNVLDNPEDDEDVIDVEV